MMHKPALQALRQVFFIGKGQKPLLTASALTLCIGISQQIFAAAQDPDIEQLNQLVTANRYEEAFNLSKQLMNEHEGEPEFDFLYGLAALETGKPNDAVFAFERITYTYQDQLRVKLELARAYYQINNFQAARQLFNDVLATNPTENVKANIKIFLDLIEERENNISGNFDFYVSTNIGSDSNINSATALGVITIPGFGNVTLSSNGKSIDDNFNDVGAGVAYNKPFSKTSALTLTGNASHHNNFSSNTFDLDVFAADATYTDINGNTRMSYGIKNQMVNLNSEPFQDSRSIIVAMQRSPGGGWSQGLTGAFTQVRYDDGLNKNANLRDVNQTLISGVLGKAIGRFSHSVSIYYGDEQAARVGGENFAQKFYGLGFSEQYQFNSTNVPYFHVSMHHSDNKGADVFFNFARADKTFSTALGWMWLMDRNINVTADVSYTNNSSNIPLYEYDRVKYQTGIRYQF